MLINSFQFLTFFLVVFIGYYLLSRQSKWQNAWLLVASYYFYGVANWHMCILLLAATVIFYFLGIGIGKNLESNERRASLLTTLGVSLGIGVLLYFKYLNFFIDSFVQLFNAVGIHCNPLTFHIVLPIGISFFTFKLMGYILDVHHGKIDATHDFIEFATFVAFFPTILSGPIDRANKFLPQLRKERRPNGEMMCEGLLQIFWGMFLKMCISDRLNIYNEAIFNNVAHHNGFSVTLACLLYPLQMYTDFCGYSDMAIGVGKMLGLKVADNFKYPFFGRNIAEYWRNWHISLTSWLTDYVFMPLNVKFRDMGKWGSELAILITFVLIGMWHNAAWTFALFGLYHGLLYAPSMMSGAFFKKKKLKLNSHRLPSLSDAGKMVWTYLLVAFGLIIFRADGWHGITEIIGGICSSWGMPFLDASSMGFSALGLVVLFLSSANGAWKTFPFIDRIPAFVKLALMVVALLVCGVFDGSQFIYFQF